MRKKQSIKELKNAGLVKNASEIEPKKWYALEGMIPDHLIKKEPSELELAVLERQIWLNDFLKRHKKSFEDFSVEVEEMYSNMKNKPNFGSKKGKESKIKEAKEYVSNWRSEYIKKKTGFEPEKRKEP